MTTLDPIDQKMVRLLQLDGRMSNAKLAAEVGLSPSACLRRLRALEASGIIRGYAAFVASDQDEPAATFIVSIVLERQTAEFLDRFEVAVRRCPDVAECYLMTGGSDYLLRVEASDMADFERIHRDQLSSLPGVARIQSSYAIRRVNREPSVHIERHRPVISL